MKKGKELLKRVAAVLMSLAMAIGIFAGTGMEVKAEGYSFQAIDIQAITEEELTQQLITC